MANKASTRSYKLRSSVQQEGASTHVDAQPETSASCSSLSMGSPNWTMHQDILPPIRTGSRYITQPPEETEISSIESSQHASHYYSPCGTPNASLDSIRNPSYPSSNPLVQNGRFHPYAPQDIPPYPPDYSVYRERNTEGFLSKYGFTIMAFVLAAVVTALARKNIILKSEITPYSPILARRQLDGVKVSLTQLHMAQNDIQDLYTKMTGLLDDFKDMADNFIVKKCENNISLSDIPLMDNPNNTALAKIETNVPEIDVDEMVDYALQSSGASIISIGDTENYRDANEITIFGISLCTKAKGPECILQTSLVPGHCWAFKGQTGQVFIKLVEAIQVTGITIDHILQEESPFDLDSAPREFSLHGINEGTLKNSKSNIYYGRFHYDIELTPTQYFSIDKKTYSVDVVELRIYSNYGNNDYTCLYRVRIHGNPDITAHEEE